MSYIYIIQAHSFVRDKSVRLGRLLLRYTKVGISKVTISMFIKHPHVTCKGNPRKDSSRSKTTLFEHSVKKSPVVLVHLSLELRYVMVFKYLTEVINKLCRIG